MEQAATFRFPGVIRISRTTGEIIGMEYTDLPAGSLAEYGDRLRRALETAQQVNHPRDPRGESEREGKNHVTL